ncbi:cell wall integrity and stress response component 3-like [Belonocnema kinseyi]|uniref:cell wall integrity and stress response component 3-like n=1 Tax=Belonocnema kinseyi TaxID=2817044 RepID=UPI00143CEEFB|nr:cell wall integrity and stress response component 3-like [Belonocnema kinseyi]
MGTFNFKFSLTILFLVFSVSQAFFLGNWQEIHLRKHGLSQKTLNAVHREICAHKCGHGFGLFFFKNKFYCATVCRDVLNESSTTTTTASSSTPSSTTSTALSSTSPSTDSSTSSSTPSSTTSTTSSSTSSSTTSLTSDPTTTTTDSVGN